LTIINDRNNILVNNMVILAFFFTNLRVLIRIHHILSGACHTSLNISMQPKQKKKKMHPEILHTQMKGTPRSSPTLYYKCLTSTLSLS